MFFLHLLSVHVHQQVIVLDCLFSGFNTDRNICDCMLTVAPAQRAPKHRGCADAEEEKVTTERNFSAE